jgi:hypothetical protein
VLPQLIAHLQQDNELHSALDYGGMVGWDVNPKP